MNGAAAARQLIEDIYPLSPMQEGMLFHSLYAPRSGVYFNQTWCVLEGDVDAAALRRAWERTVESHPVLRTGFDWQRREKPFQVVYRRVRLPWRELDWRGLEPAAEEERFGRLLEEDRARGFDLAQPPLLRFTLVCVGERRWRFAWAIHHLLVDGWCQGLIFGEVLRAYRACRQGVEPTIAPAPPYRDYIAWLARQDLTAAEAFWRRRLAGFGGATPLGLARATGAPEGAYAQRERRLPAARHAALGEALRRAGLTLSSLLQGLWGLLLARHAGEDDVVFGATVAGRPAELPGVESMVGLFINTLPVRLRLASDRPFRDWLAEIQAEAAETRRFEHTPLVEIQGWSEVPRGQPLFESLLVVENFPMEVALGGDNGLGFSIRGLASRERVNYPLSLQAVPGQDLTLRFKFAADRFSEASIDTALDQLVGLIDQFLAGPGRRVDELSLVTSGAVLPDLAAVLPAPATKSVPERVAECAAGLPDAPALVWGGRRLSYAELDRRSAALAAALRRLGLGAGEVVAVTGDRSFGLVAAMLAALRSGVLLTLDPRLPRQRRRLMLEEGRARVLLTVGEGDAAELTAGLGVTVVPVDPRAAAVRGGWEGEAPPFPDPEAPAYLFFTSGTTAVPRAVLGQHRGLGHFLDWQGRTFGIGPGERAAQLTGLSFDVVLRDVFLALTHGAALHLPTAEDLGADAVLPWLAAERITLLHTVPAVAHAWLEAAPEGIALPCLRTIFFAGEPLSGVLLRRFRAAFSWAGDAVNLYGPTETTLAKCCHRVAAGAEEEGVQPVGRPLPQTQAVVTAPAGGRLCGALEVGEIVLRTPFRSLGYRNAPEENARRFVPNPARPHDAGDLLYRTGDRGRLRPDGVLEILGRLDDQVKIRGVRVEPAEVTALLERHPAVSSAAVVARRSPGGETALAAYLVPAAGEAPAAADLAAHLARELPGAAVPAVFTVLERLPLTANGKVDRPALPEPAWAAAVPEALPQAPRTPYEEVAAAVFAEVLRRDAVGLDEDFFALGGHSLLATQAVSRLRRAFGVDLALRQLFERPTAAGVAAVVEELARAGGGAAPPLEGRPPGAAPVLSFAQERLWFFDQLEPGSAVYNVQSAVRLDGRLDPRALAAALAGVVARHEVLRTAYPAVGGMPRPAVRRHLDLPLARIDLRAVPAARREAETRRLGRLEARRPFDLARPPLFRAVLAALEARSHALFLTVHHAVADAWSLGLWGGEAAGLYRAAHDGLPSPLPPLPIQYADFAQAQRRWLAEGLLEPQLEVWRRRLAGVPPRLELPTDRPRPAAQTFRGGRLTVLCPRPLLDRLRHLARRAGATLFMVLLAALEVLLARRSGQRDLVIGTPVAGRNRVEIENLIGFFVNTLAIRADLAGEPGSPSPGFGELLARVKATVLEAHACQDLPLDHLVDALGLERDLAYNPLFQVLLVLQNVSPPAPMGGDLVMRRLEAEVGTARLDLTFSAGEQAGGLHLLADYAADLFDATTVRRLVTQLRALLEAAADDGTTRVDALPLLTPAARHQARIEWNDAAERFAGPETRLHHLFETWAQRTPDAVAVEQGEARLTYGELAAGAHRLAWRLRDLGVERGTPVALLVERSPAAQAAILAVLEAGGAFVPLDPAAPPERLAAMLEDSGAGLLVVSPAFAERGPRGRAPRLVLDLDDPGVAGRPAERPPERTGPGDLAYVLFTSGSTGRPRGVMVPHGGAVNTLRWRGRAFALRPEDRFLQNIPLTFDPSVWQVFGALASGARLVLPLGDGHQDPDHLLELMARHRVTIADFPPALLRELVADPRFAALGDLRHLFSGGEALRADLRDAFRAASRAALHNVYGPTEASIDASCWTCGGELHPHVVPIGRPIANKEILLFDDRARPVPPGTAGELAIAGAGLAWGYRDHPRRTAERFVPRSDGAPGERLYLTGDLARHLGDGSVEFLGRTDHQVKIRGVRVELGDVEAGLAALPGVTEAVVLACPGPTGGRRLEAWIVTAGEAPAEELWESARRSLPPAMVPALMRRVDALPRTAGGKVDRGALPGLDAPTLAGERAGTAPRGRAEALLAEVWRDVLGVGDVRSDSHFFELGGDSILSIRVAARARQRGLVVTAKQVFQYQTLGELAAVAGVGAAPAAEQGPVVGPVPLTPIQRWLLDAVPPSPHHFNQALMLEVRRPVAPAFFRRAAELLLAHHDALRLRFRREGGIWLQENAPVPAAPPFHHVDLGALPVPRRRGALEAAAARAETSLDLARGPLARVVLFRLGGGASDRLLLTVHHLAIDGVSWRLLVEDLGSVAAALIADREPSLPPKTTSFRAWAERLAAFARSPELAEELDFWRRPDARAPVPLPRDLPGSENLEGAVEEVSAALGAEDTRALLQEVARAFRARADEALLTALVLAFEPFTGEPSLLVDTESHGREELFDDLDLSRTVGWFTAVYPVEVEAAGPPGKRDPVATLRAVKERLRAIPRRGLGYGLLHNLCGEAVARELACGPQAEVMFNYLGQVDGGASAAGSAGALFAIAAESPGALRSPRWQRPHVFEISALVAGGALRLTWRYSRSLHRRSTIEGLAERHLEHLRALVAASRAGEPTVAVPSDFPLIRTDQAKLDRLLKKFGGRRAEGRN
ncbi:MAG TPA: amino acid adenylation domain-containing protein [Thermoanaerobaculia bacterium]